MNPSEDRLFELLPPVYRRADVEHDGTLQALLRVMAEQLDVLEQDIQQLYDNWFIETCQDWVVPYIGELVGRTPVHQAGQARPGSTPDEDPADRILVPRRDVARTIGNRRRRGAFSILGQQAIDVAGWPAHAVEFFTLLGVMQPLRHVVPGGGATVDLRDTHALGRLDGPFDGTAHTVDTRRLTTRSTSGRYNLPSVGLFVWRLRAHPVTLRQPYCQEAVGPQCYTFSALGADTPLFPYTANPPSGTPLRDELAVPEPITRGTFERRLDDIYGEGRSVQIWWIPPTAAEGRSAAPDPTARELIPPERIVVADLSRWRYRIPRGMVAVDPELGRIAFPPQAAEQPRRGIWVSYHHGFSSQVGGGEYPRELTGARSDSRIYRVGEGAPFRRINEALTRWRSEAPSYAFIEITDSTVYVEPILVALGAGQTLELRAADRCAPVIRLLDWQTEQPDSLTVTGEPGSCFVLDGLTVTGRGMRVTGELDRLVIRHCTLVPGWGLGANCEPHRPAEPSLELEDTTAKVRISRSIVGSIQVMQDEVTRDPGQVSIMDSIIDATAPDREALSAPGCRFAHTVVTVRRSTVIGQVHVHAVALAENSIFLGGMRVARRQIGCVRFSYVSPGSRTPSRYRCQPDLVLRPLEDRHRSGELTTAQLEQVRVRELARVLPELIATRYGRPEYCQLAATTAPEISGGADDESEMGVFHHLHQPQRYANLQASLEGATPAGTDAAVIIVN